MVQTHLNHKIFKIDVVRATESIISSEKEAQFIGKINMFAQQCGVVTYHFYSSGEITQNVRSHVMGLMWCTCRVTLICPGLLISMVVSFYFVYKGSTLATFCAREYCGVNVNNIPQALLHLI